MNNDEMLKMIQAVIGIIARCGCGNDGMRAMSDIIGTMDAVSTKSEIPPSLPRMTIAQAWAHYKTHIKASVKESTCAAYAYVLLTSKYARSLETHTLDEFTWPFMQLWIDSHDEHTQTLKGFMICLHGLLKYMRKMKICAVPEKWEEPFCYHIVTKRGSRELEDEHVNAIYEKAKCGLSGLDYNERQGLAVAIIGIETGLRIGEISALDCGDVKGGILNISKTLQRIYDPETKKTKVIVGTPKTKTSERSIPISRFLQDFLSEFSSGKSEDRPLFETSTGKKQEVRTLRLYFEKLLDKLGIPRINVHSLRHTFISRKIREGKNPKAVSAYAGHSDIKITLSTYTHVNKQDLLEVTE